MVAISHCNHVPIFMTTRPRLCAIGRPFTVHTISWCMLLHGKCCSAGSFGYSLFMYLLIVLARIVNIPVAFFYLAIMQYIVKDSVPSFSH